jgi:hypothetical protein
LLPVLAIFYDGSMQQHHDQRVAIKMSCAVSMAIMSISMAIPTEWFRFRWRHVTWRPHCFLTEMKMFFKLKSKAIVMLLSKGNTIVLGQIP